MTKQCTCNPDKIDPVKECYLIPKLAILERPNKKSMFGALSSVIHRKCGKPVHPKTYDYWEMKGKLSKSRIIPGIKQRLAVVSAS